MNSIKEIALKAKVSTGTVDRVIHNRPGVSEKTKQKVLKIIEDSNYKVNAVASILASKKTFTIAILLPKPKNESDFWQLPIDGINNAYNEVKNLGFNISYFEYDQFNSNSYVDAIKKLANSKPNAALIAPLFNQETKKHIHLLEDPKIPYLFINAETTETNSISFIGQKSHQAGFVAGKLFNWVLPKNSEILIIEIRKNVTNYNAINNRIEGFNDFFHQSNKFITTNRITIGDIDDEKQVYNQLKIYLEQHPNTKGIFVPSSKINSIAQSIIQLDRNDIELGGFDNTKENISYLKDGVIDFLIGQKPEQQGYEGIKTLFNYLIHKTTPVENAYLPIDILLKENIDFL